jgi:uncharacterized protein DUF3105
VPATNRPWGPAVAGAVLVIVVGGVVGYAVTRDHGTGGSGSVATATRSAMTTTPPPSPSSSVNPADPYTRPEIAAAKRIPGLTYRPEPDHTHVATTVHYDSSPPVGGDHSQIWADCAGTVYPHAIANENAVHMLEHGAVWITYRPGLSAADVAALSKLVTGVDHTAMSPYPGLRGAISVQAWDYQVFVAGPADPRLRQFISALRSNPATAPEAGGPCSDPLFKKHPSTFGHPIFQF